MELNEWLVGDYLGSYELLAADSFPASEFTFNWLDFHNQEVETSDAEYHIVLPGRTGYPEEFLDNNMLVGAGSSGLVHLLDS